ncbi:unnamed protein product [Lupinus luteus]|uniref:Macro domain-containing protein n=1 Tax=Lupinus luteus TaxID=3873 RepID=A0AAV1X9N9_LUPLU
MYRPVATSAVPRSEFPNGNGDSVVILDQIPWWIDAENSLGYDNGDSSSYFPDPLASQLGTESDGSGLVSRFPVHHEVNSRIYLWWGNPWNLEVDAVVNSTNEILDEAHSSPGLHAAAGPGLAEECATLDGCRTGMAKITNAYDLPARKVIHTVGPKYAVKYHTAAENALSHCYRSYLELLIENRLQRLLPLYFPRDKHEEEVALSKLPADVGDENGETVIDDRKIRIKPLPKETIPKPPVDLPVSDVGLVLRTSYLDSFLDPAFMSLIKDPDERRS